MGVKSPNPIDRTVGQNIRFQRMAKGLSQEAVADRLGLTFQQIQKYEKGTNRVSARRLVELASLFGTSITTLFDGVDLPKAINNRTVTDILNEPRAIELLRAFSSIESEDVRGSIVNLALELSRTYFSAANVAGLDGR